jgi:hypothetical protein
MCRITAESLESPLADAASIEPIRRFATDFRDVGYQLLRHSDRELFDRFLELLDGWTDRQRSGRADRLHRLRDDCLRFADILDKALEAVCRRAELSNLPMDERAYGRLLAEHLGGR